MIITFSTLLHSTSKSALVCLYIVTLVLITIVQSYNHTVFAANKTPASILVLGDSLSAAYGIDIDTGWVALLQQQINKEGYDYKVINVSVSGDTTRTGLSRVDSALEKHQPAVVIIALGGNDGLRGLAFSEIETSLSNIIERCKKTQSEILLVGVRMPPNYGAVYSQKFAQLYQGLATRYDIVLLPKMLDQVADNPELMQADGIHPKAEAHPKIMQNIWSALKPVLDIADNKEP